MRTISIKKNIKIKLVKKIKTNILIKKYLNKINGRRRVDTKGKIRLVKVILSINKILK